MARTGQMPISALVREYFVGRLDVCTGERALPCLDSQAPRRFQHAAAHDARDAAAVNARRQQGTPLNDEHVRHRSTDDVTGAVEHQAFRDRGIGPFAACQHLLESIEMLESREDRILAERRAAVAHGDAGRGPFRRMVRPIRETHDARRHCGCGRPVTARAYAARDDELEYAACDRARLLHELLCHLCLVDSFDPEARTAAQQALEVVCEAPDLPVNHGHGFKEAISILQAAIARRDRGLLAPVHPDAIAHCSCPSARMSPRALARVSSSSRCGSLSATMPAPARK